MRALQNETEHGVDFIDRDDALRSFASRLVLTTPPERRSVLALAIAPGASYREIAQRLDLTEDTVKAHIREGLTIIRQQVMDRATTTPPALQPVAEGPAAARLTIARRWRRSA